MELGEREPSPPSASAILDSSNGKDTSVATMSEGFLPSLASGALDLLACEAKSSASTINAAYP
jgi:hypothetical protein